MAFGINPSEGKCEFLTSTMYEKYGDVEKAYQKGKVIYFFGKLPKGTGAHYNTSNGAFIIVDEDGVNHSDDILVCHNI